MEVIKIASPLYERFKNVHYRFLKVFKICISFFMSVSKCCIKIYEGHKKNASRLYERVNHVHHDFMEALKI